MSGAFKTWAAITLGAICFRAADPSAFPNVVFLVLGVSWQVFALWAAFKGLRGSL